MVCITIKEAKERLMESRLGLYAGLVSDLQHETVISKSRAYVCHGGVIIQTPWCDSEKRVLYLCETGGSDMDAALAELEKAKQAVRIKSQSMPANAKGFIA